MVNFIVVDDNKNQRKKINDIIVSKMMNNKIEFNIIEFKDYSEKIFEYMETKDTIFILDLELPSGDGLDLARKLRNVYNNWNTPIIIITIHTSLYFEAYKQRLQILDFIPKCANVEKSLSENIDICLKMLNKEKVYRFIYKGVDHSINFNLIDYFQRDGRKTKIVTKDKVYYRNLSIKEILEQLPKYFVLSSKGTIINMKNVDEIDWTECKVYFKDGVNDYLVSKNHKKEINNYDIL